jgi:hypothetical protein
VRSERVIRRDRAQDEVGPDQLVSSRPARCCG